MPKTHVANTPPTLPGERALPSAVPGEPPEVLVANGATLLDVRSPTEYADAHIIGARNVPLSEIDRNPDVGPKDQPIVVYCRSGNRSARAAKILRANGYLRVVELGAMSNWKGPTTQK